MKRVYDETNAQKSDMGEHWNQYFLKAVDKKVSSVLRETEGIS